MRRFSSQETTLHLSWSRNFQAKCFTSSQQPCINAFCSQDYCLAVHVQWLKLGGGVENVLHGALRAVVNGTNAGPDFLGVARFFEKFRTLLMGWDRLIGTSFMVVWKCSQNHGVLQQCVPTHTVLFWGTGSFTDVPPKKLRLVVVSSPNISSASRNVWNRLDRCRCHRYIRLWGGTLFEQQKTAVFCMVAMCLGTPDHKASACDVDTQYSCLSPNWIRHFLTPSWFIFRLCSLWRK